MQVLTSGNPAVMRPAVGLISYVNCLPVAYPLVQGHVLLDGDLVLAPPAELNNLFAAGSLAVSAMSSFYFLSRGDLSLVEGLGISASQAVASVLLFSKEPPDKLAGKTILADSDSATSVNLTRVLLAELYGLSPLIVSSRRPDLLDPLCQADAALVIGDHAMAVDEEWSKHFVRTDLGELWVGATGLPIVFGLWAGPRSYAGTESVGRILCQARDLGLGTLYEQVLDQSEAACGISRLRLDRYYRQNLDFSLSEKHLCGLKLFASLARKQGLLGPNSWC